MLWVTLTMNNIPNFYIYFLISEMDTNAVAISQLVLGSWSFNRKGWMGVAGRELRDSAQQ